MFRVAAKAPQDRGLVHGGEPERATLGEILNRSTQWYQTASDSDLHVLSIILLIAGLVVLWDGNGSLGKRSCSVLSWPEFDLPDDLDETGSDVVKKSVECHREEFG